METSIATPDFEVPEHVRVSQEAELARLRETGQPIEDVVFVDYFGMDIRHRTELPDGRSFVEHKELSEGERKKIQNESQRDVRLQKVTGDALIRSRPGDERHSLLRAAITGWNLRSAGAEVPFNDRNLQKFLDTAPPRVIDLIQKDIYKHNPWLLQEMTVEEIDKQIADLQEMREVKVQEEEGKGSSPR